MLEVIARKMPSNLINVVELTDSLEGRFIL